MRVGMTDRAALHTRVDMAVRRAVPEEGRRRIHSGVAVVGKLAVPHSCPLAPAEGMAVRRTDPVR